MPKDDSTLTLGKGSAVFVPARIWPNEKPPKGKKGWEGQIVRDHDKASWVVKFNGDANKYFFKKADLEKWTKTEFGASGLPAQTAVKTPKAGPSTTTPASPSRKLKPIGRMSTGGGTLINADDSDTESDIPPKPTSSLAGEKAAVVKEIQTLLPLIPVGDLISLRLDIRRMAGKLR